MLTKCQNLFVNYALIFQSNIFSIFFLGLKGLVEFERDGNQVKGGVITPKLEFMCPCNRYNNNKL